MPSNFALIETQTLVATTATVTFSAIPGNYADLLIKLNVRTDQNNPTATFKVRYNGSSALNYSATHLYWTGSGSSISYRQSAADNMEIGGATALTGTANTFGATEIYIPNYAGNLKKRNSSFYTGQNNSDTSFLIGIASGLRSITDPITSVSFVSAGLFEIGSSFYLYGISNA